LGEREKKDIAGPPGKSAWLLVMKIEQVFLIELRKISIRLSFKLLMFFG